MQRRRGLRTRIQALALCLGGLLALSAAPLSAQSHHFVYLSAAGAHTISGFELNPSSGALTQIAGSPFNEGHDPAGLAFHPSGRFLYAVNPSGNNVSAFAVNPVTGVLTELPASPFPVGGGATPKFIAVEPAGKFLYVVSTLASGTITSISNYAIDATGSLNTAADVTISRFLSPAGLVFKPGDHFLYLAGTASTNGVSILTLELDPATGTLTGLQTFAGLGQFARSVAVAPQGQFLFVGRGQSQGSIDTYALPANGILSSPLSTFPVVAGTLGLPFVLAADVSGSHLYAGVANQGVVGYSADPGSGVLTALPPGPPSLGPPISPSAVLLADSVTQFPYLYYDQRVFGISGLGALTELPASPLPVAGVVTGIAAASPLDPVQPISAPQLTLAPSTILFNDQYVGAVSQARQVSLSNIGNAPLIISNIFLTFLTGTNASEFGLSFGDCGAVLPSNNGCTLTITFQPLFEGPRQAALSVVDNAPGSPQTVTLAGAGLLPFSIESDSSLNASVPAGQMAQYNLRLAPAPGFVGRVLLACSGAPAEAACDIPSSLDLNGVAPAPFSVRVPTKARSALAPLVRPSHLDFGNERSRRILVWAAGLTLLLLLLPGLRTLPTASSVEGIRIHYAIVLLVCVSLGLVSCSGATSVLTSNSTGATPSTGTSSTSPAPAPAPTPTPAAGTPAGQYVLTLTATAASGSAAQVRQLSLSVQ